MHSNRLDIDIETKCPLDLSHCGVYAYASAATIFIVAYSFGDGPVQLWDCTDGSPMPDDLRAALLDNAVVKVAHNANFERTLIKACWGIECPPESWRCTMVMALANGLPGGLAEAAHVLDLAEQKDPIGKKLIKMFSSPQKPTKNQPKLWLTKEDRPAEWEQFKAYCIRDLEVARAIRRQLRDLSPREWALWCIDQRANDVGFLVNMDLVNAAIAIHDVQTDRLMAEATKITGLKNPNSVAQLKTWLHQAHGETITSLNKAALGDITARLSGDAQRMLEIRAQLGMTSTDKFRAMARSVCSDGYVRGLLQFHGARTGRWAGRLVQIQNMARSTLEES
jgi:DNA polymerase